MTVYTYITTYPNGKLNSICGAVFGSETEATDQLYQLFNSDNWRVFWSDTHYQIYERTSSGMKHIFDAYIISFETAY